MRFGEGAEPPFLPQGLPVLLIHIPRIDLAASGGGGCPRAGTLNGPKPPKVTPEEGLGGPGGSSLPSFPLEQAHLIQGLGVGDFLGYFALFFGCTRYRRGRVIYLKQAADVAGCWPGGLKGAARGLEFWGGAGGTQATALPPLLSAEETGCGQKKRKKKEKARGLGNAVMPTSLVMWGKKEKQWKKKKN